MGVNNKQRRAARKKARARRADRSAGVLPPPPHVPRAVSPFEVRQLLVEALAEIAQGTTTAAGVAALVLEPSQAFPPELARAGLRDLLTDLVTAVVRRGWAPSDVAEVTRRQAGDAVVPLALGLLADHVGRFPGSRVAPAWLDDLRGAGSARPVRLIEVSEVQDGLELALVLGGLPALPAVLPAPGDPGSPAHASAGDQKLLARVQALLAKAEATEFDDEAEALSAKAQELVSRYALDRLLESAQSGVDERPAVRRMWLDAPYVLPKAMLVHVVAEANRCRSVVAEKLGCCTLVGQASDLDAVELLVPSLLVQAHAGLSRFGRQTDRRGTSRTRSFRQSFLLAYANRIGERLTAVDAAARSADPRAGELVPLLHRQKQRVDVVVGELFPHVVERAGSVGNAYGWAAGRAAADQALIGADLQVRAAAG